MHAYTWEKIPAERLDHNIVRRMIVGQKEMLVRWEFKKGALAARHSHPHEQVVMMVHGKLAWPSGRTRPLWPHDIVVIPPQVPRSRSPGRYCGD